MNSIPDEEEIHKMYEDMQRKVEMRFSRLSSNSNDPNALNNPPSRDPFTERQSFTSNSGRFDRPSFRSDYFNVGQGLQTLNTGETKLLAKITVPAQHAGVLTGFSQFFADCETYPEMALSITWSLRINGLPPLGFADFVGEFSSLMIPHSVYFPLIGGASTLGDTRVSLGGQLIGEDDIPTVTLSATNNFQFGVVLQGRLVGYTFPVAERNDEFQNF